MSVFRIKHLMIMIVAYVAVGVAVPADAIAQGYSIEISPVKHSIELAPGTIAKRSITVRNTSDFDQKLFFDAEDFTVAGSSGETRFFDSENRDKTFSLQEWISFEEEFIIVPAQDQAEFGTIITVPEDAEPGGHYAAVFVQTASPDAIENRSAIESIGRIGSLMLVTVQGDITRDLSLNSFDVAGPDLFSGSSEVEVSTSLGNDGNVHVVPGGTITVSGAGVSPQKIALNDAESAVLPAVDDREFSHTIALEKDGLLPAVGRVTVALDLTYDDGQTISSQQSFLVVPLRFMAVSLAAIAAAAFVLWRVSVSFKMKRGF